MKICSERHSRGQILPLTALLLTVLVGFMGLAVDAGYLFDYNRRMTTAADSGALAGAWQLRRNPNSTNDAIKQAAWTATTANGFANATNNITVTVNHPPANGYHVGDNKFVEVLINRPHPTFFMRALHVNTATVAARAVAGPGEEKGCMYVLKLNDNAALQVSGGAILDSPQCGIYVNSNMKTTTGARVQADSVYVGGSVSGNGVIVPSPVTGVPPAPDPFAYLQAPSTAGPCLSPSGTPPVYNPGRYCSKISLTGNSNGKFNPGLYILDAGLSITGSIQPSTGVTFYVNGGSIAIAGQAGVSLTAPTSGQWEGILFFQNRANSQAADFTGGASLHLTGILYFPSALVKYAGGDINTAYTLIVSNTLTITGISEFHTDYSSLANGDPVKRPTLSE